MADPLDLMLFFVAIFSLFTILIFFTRVLWFIQAYGMFWFTSRSHHMLEFRHIHAFWMLWSVRVSDFIFCVLSIALSARLYSAWVNRDFGYAVDVLGDDVDHSDLEGLFFHTSILNPAVSSTAKDMASIIWISIMTEVVVVSNYTFAVILGGIFHRADLLRICRGLAHISMWWMSLYFATDGEAYVVAGTDAFILNMVLSEFVITNLYTSNVQDIWIRIKTVTELKSIIRFSGHLRNVHFLSFGVQLIWNFVIPSEFRYSRLVLWYSVSYFAIRSMFYPKNQTLGPVYSCKITMVAMLAVFIHVFIRYKKPGLDEALGMLATSCIVNCSLFFLFIFVDLLCITVTVIRQKVYFKLNMSLEFPVRSMNSTHSPSEGMHPEEIDDSGLSYEEEKALKIAFVVLFQNADMKPFIRSIGIAIDPQTGKERIDVCFAHNVGRSKFKRLQRNCVTFLQQRARSLPISCTMESKETEGDRLNMRLQSGKPHSIAAVEPHGTLHPVTARPILKLEICNNMCGSPRDPFRQFNTGFFCSAVIHNNTDEKLEKASLAPRTFINPRSPRCVLAQRLAKGQEKFEARAGTIAFFLYCGQGQFRMFAPFHTMVNNISTDRKRQALMNKAFSHSKDASSSFNPLPMLFFHCPHERHQPVPVLSMAGGDMDSDIAWSFPFEPEGFVHLRTSSDALTIENARIALGTKFMFRGSIKTIRSAIKIALREARPLYYLIATTASAKPNEYCYRELSGVLLNSIKLVEHPVHDPSDPPPMLFAQHVQFQGGMGTIDGDCGVPVVVNINGDYIPIGIHHLGNEKINLAFSISLVDVFQAIKQNAEHLGIDYMGREDENLTLFF